MQLTVSPQARRAVLAELTENDRQRLADPAGKKTAVYDIAARIDGTAGLSSVQLKVVLSEATIEQASKANELGRCDRLGCVN